VLPQLRVILAAEAEARQQLEHALQEAERLVQQAEEDARRMVRAAHEARGTTAQGVEDRLVAAAQEKARQLATDAAAKIAALRRLAEPRMERAVAIILQHLLARGGNPAKPRDTHDGG
jgi:vacuolar-type H+-ATPase subunit H